MVVTSTAKTVRDGAHTARADGARARVLLAEGLYAEAERVAGGAVRALERGGEQSLLAEALTTHGTALARTGKHERARATLQRAFDAAVQAGDSEGAGLAALAVVEELGEQVAAGELSVVYERAADLLCESQHSDIVRRLLSCSRAVVRRLAGERAHSTEAGGGAAGEVPASWEGFSLKKEMRRYERGLIERALHDAGGVVTRAAQLLGFKHHYSLIALINNSHKDLLQIRSPIVPRKRSLVRGADSPDAHQAETQASQAGAMPYAAGDAEDKRVES